MHEWLAMQHLTKCGFQFDLSQLSDLDAQVFIEISNHMTVLEEKDIERKLKTRGRR